MLVVAALGGNALQRRGEPLTHERMEANARIAAEALATIAAEHQLVVTHGNGPQVGLLALQSEAYRDMRSYPLDVLGAETEGMIGYVLERELANALPGRRIATLLTQTVVDALDPAFRAPTKPIGPTYDAKTAKKLASERGWNVAADNGGWRRVVASPVPRSIVETEAIRLLVDQNVVVVCAGGGGIPIVLDAAGARHGVEAVVDKDASSALLARSLGADVLLLLTDVAAVQENFGTKHSRAIERATPADLASRSFPAGSMGPKVAAACNFVAVTGGRAVIGALGDAARMLAGEAGTQISGRAALEGAR